MPPSIPVCAFCGSPETLPDTEGKTSTNLMCCAKCQAVSDRRVYYCSRPCQVADYRSHKLTCGTLELPPPPPTLPSSSSEPPLPPITHWSYQPLPSSPPLPIPLSSSTASLLPYLLTSASPSSSSSQQQQPPSSLPIILLYSLLLPFVEAAGGTEEGLVGQLRREYGVELRDKLDEEEDWEEDALWDAVGESPHARSALLAWQIDEADATR